MKPSRTCRLRSNDPLQIVSPIATPVSALFLGLLLLLPASAVGETGEEPPRSGERGAESRDEDSSRTNSSRNTETAGIEESEKKKDSSTTSNRSTEGAEAPRVPFGFDFVPFVGTSSAFPSAIRTVSFNFVGGISGGIEAVEMGGALNLTLGDVRGLQFSGAGNAVLGSVDGAQAAAAFNFARRDIQGLQAAGAVGVAGRDMQGLQTAGAVNLAGRNIRGVQVSGALNVAGGDVNGLQLGVANVSTGAVDGLQLGVFNFASKSTASAGLVSIVPQGFADLEVVATSEGLTTAGLRHGGEHIYNLYYVGSYFGPESPRPAAGLGIGFRHPFNSRWEFSVDATATAIYRDLAFDGSSSPATLLQLRPFIAWRPIEDVAVFAGPTLNQQTVDSDNAIGSVDRFGAWEWSLDGGGRALVWPGFALGMRYL